MENKDQVNMVVNFKAWQKIPLEEQLWMIFSTTGEHNQRLKKLERPVIRTAVTFLGGILGGILAVFGLRISTGGAP